MDVSCCSAAAPSLPLPLPLPPRPAPRSPAPPCVWELSSLVRPVDPDADGSAVGTDAIAEIDVEPSGTVGVAAPGMTGACSGAGGVEAAALAACSAEAVAPVASEPSASARLICAWPRGCVLWPALEALSAPPTPSALLSSWSFPAERSEFANAALVPSPAVRAAAPEAEPAEPAAALEASAVTVEFDPADADDAPDPPDPDDGVEAGALPAVAALPVVTALPAASVVPGL